MKKLVTGFAVLCMTVVSAYANGPGIVSQSAADVFTPKGFDDNDNAQVILEGVFGNTCFHVAPAHSRIDQANKRIYIDNQINQTPGCTDAMMYIPYTRTVELGQISQGSYDVMISDGKGSYEKRSVLPVAQSKPSAFGTDEYLYAPVTELSFQYGQAGADPTVTLKGSFSNSCLSLSSVKVNIREGNVVEVLPISTMATRSDCQAAATPFGQTVTVPGFPNGDVLIQVRVMGGQALNRVITPLDRFVPIPVRSEE